MSSGKDYKVGFAKPPEETRFKKGVSGNPNGRPPKMSLGRGLSRRQLITDILQVMEEDVIIRSSTGTMKVPTMVALLKKAREQALGGDRITARFLLRTFDDALRERDRDLDDSIVGMELKELEQALVRRGLTPDEQAALSILRRLSRKLE